MTANQEKLINLLKEMFQFDQADLDFGIYRIMNMRHKEISQFIEEKLPAEITESLKILADVANADELAVIEKQIADTKASPLSDAIKQAAINELQSKKNEIISQSDISAVEADVYNHLTNFFARYYDEGDFISQRRYKDGVYAIPYEGEEVKLHWANADQYYIKTSEYFKDYTFKTPYGKTVHFKLIEAETDKDNNKASEKRFFQLSEEKQFEVVNDELMIYMEYKGGDEKKQDKYNVALISAYRTQCKDFQQYQDILNEKDGKTILERQLNRYTARNTFDYFIHKDLKKFLSRELDFYIKNDVIFLDDIEEQDERKTKEYLTKAKVIRKIAKKIIQFLAQIEDFQKKLYLKKKFVVETNYCITLDRIPEEFYPEIAANEKQREEWVRLFAIDEITGDLVTEAYSEPLTVEFLKANQFLLLDTVFYDDKLKGQMIDSIDDLEASLDGLMIQSENFQALNLLKDRYFKELRCIYIDPPFNAKSSEILYKNNFKHSSWLSLVENRITCSLPLINEESTYITAIDEIECEKLGLVEDMILGNIFDGKATVSVLINPSGQQGKNFSTTNETVYFYFQDRNNHLGKQLRWNNPDVRDFMNGAKGKAENYLRKTGKNCFYSIYVLNNQIVGFGEVCADEFHPSSPNVLEKDGIIAIYPIDSNGVERKWIVQREEIENKWIGNNDENKNGDRKLIVKEKNGLMRINQEKYLINYKTIWYDGKYSAKEYGTTLLNNIIGIEKMPSNLYPKSLYSIIDCLKIALNHENNSIILDYFAGSGTTGHAVINLNREDNGHRKYILVEMGEYFDTVTRPRIEKVIYSEDWKDGKPVSRKGSSHAFKYLRLESYEDALNNIVLKDAPVDLLGAAGEDYFFSYMLDVESKDSSSLLNVKQLSNPFSYKMNITQNLESKECTIDLVETFNYLIGLTVEHSYARTSFDADFITGEYGAVTAKLKKGSTYQFKMIEGTLRDGERALVLWRELTDDVVKDNAVLDAFFMRKKISTTDFEYKKIYVNGDNNLQNVRSDDETWKVILIEDEMQSRMFENLE